ncbi:hypothetical protein LIA77_10694 [Sarocladium implicatum]|nr:hypothetical protein LIA77_10694 [Sarocladium implicatum]
MAPSEVLVKTAKAYLKGLNDINADAIAAVTAPEFVVRTAPVSANIGDSTGEVTRERLLQQYTFLTPILNTLNLTLKREWPANEAFNQVSLLYTGDFEFHTHIVGDDKKEDWQFKPEVLYIFTMDESGEKIKELFEFQDSIPIQGLQKLFEKAMGQAGAQAAPSIERPSGGSNVARDH